MSKVSGLLLILAGVGIAAYVLPSTIEAEAEAPEPAPQSEVAKVLPAEPARQASASSPGARADQPPAAAPVAPKPQLAVRTPSAAAPSAPVVITLARRAGEPPSAVPARAASIPDRATLARELQRELKRVGCYDGELNGAWTVSTKRAMKSFTDRVNASLPVEEPDYILLTLVQGHQDRACGKPCPTDQALAEDGRCTPSAILARAKRPAAPNVAVVHKSQPPVEAPKRVVTGWSTNTVAAVPTAPSAPTPDGRMSLAGPPQQPPGEPAVLVSPPTPRGPELRADIRRHVAAPPPPRQRSADRSRDWGRKVFSRQDEGR